MEIIKVNPGSNVFLGRQGENLAREIVFNIAPWVETYGQGNAQLLYRRKGDRDPYLVAVRQEGNEVHWLVSKPDTDVSGAGFYELHYYSGQTLVKSATGDTFVEGTMTSAMETPDPYKSWVDQVIEAAQSVPQTVEAALQEAKESGEFDGPKGDLGDQGDSAYEIAVKYGYEGTEEEWIAELQGNAAKSAAEAAKSAAKAEEAKEDALVSANQTRQAVISASNFVGHASAHAANAKTASESAQAAASRAENAERYTSSDREQVAEMKANTLQYQTAAANSETNAKTSEQNAAASAEEAKKAAEEAKNAGGIKTVNGQKPDENGNVEIEVGSGSGVEVTAKPGQLIRVKETDENGKPTAWEAVPWGYTEGGMVEIPVSGEWTDSSQYIITAPMGLEAGNTYTVVWDGVEYTTTARNENVEGVSMVAMGNMFGESTEPFGISELSAEAAAQMGIYGMAVPYESPGFVDFTIYHNAEIPHPIPGELLPEGVPYVEDGGMVEILAECQPEYIEDEGMFLLTENAPPFVVGETYIVNWNGTEYTCVGQDLSAMAPGAVGLGDVGLSMGGTSTGEPFMIVSGEEGGTQVLMMVSFDGTTKLTLSIKSVNETIRKLDNRCLDLDWIPTKKVKETVVLPEMLTSEYSKELNPTSLPIGTVVAVYWDGVRHECTVSTVEGSENAHYFGYLNGNPFAFVAMYQSLPYTINCADGGEHTVSVSLVEYEYNVIPAGYLGESTSAPISLIDLGMPTVGTDAEVTFSTDTSEIMKKLKNGAKTKVVFRADFAVDDKSTNGTVTAIFDGTHYFSGVGTIKDAFLFSEILRQMDCLFAITLRVEEGQYVASVHKLLDSSAG